MRREGHLRVSAHLSAVVLLLVATAISWSQQPSLTWLGTLPGFVGSEAWGVSADGSVVVGRASNAERQSRAFRWTAVGGMQNLGTLPGFAGSGALGISADGSVVVGRATYAYWLGTRAFRWTAAGGMQDLGTLPGGGESEAWGVSADGRVVVGRASNAERQSRAFRWTAAGGMEDLGTLGGVESWAFGISADGRVVVGKAQNAAWQYRAFRWTEAGGMEDLNITYASLLTDGSYLWRATAISPDGRYIVGLGSRGAFLLDTGFPLRGDVDRNGCVDDADLLRVLFAFGGRATATKTSTGMV